MADNPSSVPSDRSRHPRPVATWLCLAVLALTSATGCAGRATIRPADAPQADATIDVLADAEADGADATSSSDSSDGSTDASADTADDVRTDVPADGPADVLSDKGRT